MSRFEQKSSAAIYLVVLATTFIVFGIDNFTPLGITDWVFYLIPVILTLFVWRPFFPFVSAALVTILMVLGLVLSPPGLDRNTALLNRSFAVITIWTLALIGYQFIRGRLVVRKQQWLQSGQTGLSAVMAGDPQLHELGDNILKFLAEYIGAQAGAIFIEEGSQFRRFASYAVPAGADVPQQFAPGDGLLGRAVKDKRAFVVDNVPDGYLAIGSALGKSSPRNLLVASIMADGTVNAVVELGLLQRVHESDRELLERVSESIGVAIQSAKYRTRLQELLEETQRQAEELQAQSEELRVSNEELEEQSRALKESQARLEQQQAELEQTNAQLEEQAQILETQKDDLARAKTDLEYQARIVEQASRYKSDFLANMSHELRTPLNSSLILAKLLADNREGNLTPEQVKYASTIQSAGRDLLALINDVLDLSKIEAGHMELTVEDLPVAKLLDELRGTFEPLAGHKGLSLRMQSLPGAPEKVRTDHQRLSQILKNLLSNALKFTERGEVSLEVNRAPGNRVAFAVRDTGIGISPDQQEIVFDPFCQADGTTSRKYGGTGLGLSISRELARILEGDITLKSEPGRGSIFTVLVPEQIQPGSAASAHPPAPPAPAPSSRSTKDSAQKKSSTPLALSRTIVDDRERLTSDRRIILVVEDDESFAAIISDLAHEQKFQTLVATTAEEALALAQQHSPSAIVLDIGLPDNSGMFVLERLKTDARTRHIPVHVVSGSDYSQTALAMGAVGYMLKPVDREQLAGALQRLETRLTQKLRRVLLVEDDPVQRESLGHLLGSQEVETVGVGTAAECLEKLKNETFDCMVLDLSLPDASGFTLLETLTAEDKYSFPPVIVYTGRELSPEQEQRLRRYSKSIIIKGAKSPERLLDEVTLFLHQVVSNLPPEQQKMLASLRGRDSVLEGKRVLVVEDDVRNIFALSSVLEPAGVKVQIARNGREALEQLAQSSQAGAPSIDLVLMDIMMPEMDGLTAMKEIRKKPEWKKLPLIALTAKAMKQDQEQCLEAGANDYLAKPLDVEKLLSLVRVWMPR